MLPRTETVAEPLSVTATCRFKVGRLILPDVEAEAGQAESHVQHAGAAHAGKGSALFWLSVQRSSESVAFSPAYAPRRKPLKCESCTVTRACDSTPSPK